MKGIQAEELSVNSPANEKEVLLDEAKEAGCDMKEGMLESSDSEPRTTGVRKCCY